MEQKFELGQRVFYVDDYKIKSDIIESVHYTVSAPYARKGNLDRINKEYHYQVYDSSNDEYHNISQSLLFESKEELLKSL